MAALDPARRKIRIPRSLTPNEAPIGLLEGELGVELANPGAPRLWVGVPSSVDASLRRIVADGSLYIANPDTAGNFLRTNTGTWVAGLPLTGGMLTPVPNDIGLDINNIGTGNSLVVRAGATNHLVMGANGNITLSNAARDSLPFLQLGGGTLGALNDAGAGTGLALTISASAAFSRGIRLVNISTANTSAALHIDNNSPGRGVEIMARAGGRGVFVDVPATAFGVETICRATGTGVYVTGGAAGRGIHVLDGSPCVSINQTGAGQCFNVFNRAGVGFYIENFAAAIGPAVDINNNGTQDSLRIRNGATNHLVIAADGTITLSPQAIASLQAALGI